MIIEAENLKDAYNRAANTLGCSVTQLNVRVLQHPSGGFLGFFKKNAVIEAVLEGEKFSENPEFSASQNKTGKAEKKQGDKSEPQSPRTAHPKHRKEKQKAVVTDENLIEIKEKLSALFKSSEFKIEVSEVSKIDENTVYIKLQGALVYDLQLDQHQI